MFELFVQGDRTPARTEGGLGIGLTLVKALAEMHGGSISASSEGPGQGSEFVITLPAADGPIPTGGAGDERRVGREAERGPGSSSSTTTWTRPAAWRGSSRPGHEVRTAHDGPAALAAAGEQRPEFVLLDIGLPGMDGYEVASRLRRERGAGTRSSSRSPATARTRTAAAPRRRASTTTSSSRSTTTPCSP